MEQPVLSFSPQDTHQPPRLQTQKAKRHLTSLLLVRINTLNGRRLLSPHTPGEGSPSLPSLPSRAAGPLVPEMSHRGSRRSDPPPPEGGPPKNAVLPPEHPRHSPLRWVRGREGAHRSQRVISRPSAERTE